MSSPEKFFKIVNATSYQGKDYTRLVSLTNMTFFLGAGFSKSWNKNYPTGAELFALEREDLSNKFLEFLESIGYSEFKNMTFEDFKEIAYQLSMQKKYPSIRRRYIDEYNLAVIENEINSIITKRFNRFLKINYIKNAGSKLKLEKTPNDNQLNIVNFFRWLNSHTTGDTEKIPEGLRLNFITTNYDFLMESIMDETLGDDDSHLIYTYRGFTPLKTNNHNTPTIVHNHWLVQNLIKLNGGFEIFQSHDGSGFEIDYTSKDDSALEINAPKLVLPNREQDYTGKYFQTIFPKAVRTLQESQILVIVGYSIPDEDALIRLLLRQFAEENVDGTEKVIFYIDLISEEEQIKKLERIFPYQINSIRYNVIPYSGYFTDWVNEILDKNNKV